MKDSTRRRNFNRSIDRKTPSAMPHGVMILVFCVPLVAYLIIFTNQ